MVSREGRKSRDAAVGGVRHTPTSEVTCTHLPTHAAFLASEVTCAATRDARSAERGDVSAGSFESLGASASTSSSRMRLRITRQPATSPFRRVHVVMVETPKAPSPSSDCGRGRSAAVRGSAGPRMAFWPARKPSRRYLVLEFVGCGKWERRALFLCIANECELRDDGLGRRRGQRRDGCCESRACA